MGEQESAANRRREDRLSVGIPCRIGIAGDTPAEAFVMDWSESGVGLRTTRPLSFAPGQTVRLTASSGKMLDMTVAWQDGLRMGLQGDGADVFTLALAELAGIPLPDLDIDEEDADGA